MQERYHSHGRRRQHAVQLGVIGLLVIALVTGCGASKEFVRTQVSDVSTNVQSLDKRVSQLEAESDEALSLARQNRDKTEAALSGVRDLNAQEVVDYEVVRTVTVHFDFDRASLTPEAKKTLDGLIHELSMQPTTGHLQVQGFADASGSDEYNQWLSDRRARSVSRYLAMHMDASRLFPMTDIGLGTSHPIADNAIQKGRSRNRRVEVHVLVPSRADVTMTQSR